MDAEEIELVDSLLRGQLGKSIKWRFYDRTLQSPLNFVLERAEQQLDRAFQVCWVDNAPPEIFCLRGLSQPLVVYCTRYVEIWADIRSLVTSTIWGAGMLERLAASHCLALMAEFSLEENDPEFAASAIVESILRKEEISQIPNSIDSLEHEPISFGYIATWFYGLCHELGHLRGDNDTPLLKEEWIVDAAESSLKESAIPEALRKEAMASIRSGDSSFLLNPRNLQSEGLADVFAAGVFLRSMHDLESNAPGDRVDFAGALICEMLLSLNIIAIFERCRRVAHHASVGFPPSARSLDAVLHPAAVGVRSQFMLMFLRNAVAAYLFGGGIPTERQFAAVDSLIDGGLKSIRPNLERFETGMNAAIAFAADRERRTTFMDQLKMLRTHLRSSEPSVDRITIEQFVARAHSLGLHSRLFDALLTQLRNPEEAALPDVAGDRGFVCAWVVGPDGYNSPFGLQTRYGFVIFAFAPGSRLYETFAEASKGDLVKDFELKTTFILADTDQALRVGLAKHLPVGSAFTVVVEGSAEFDTYMRELSEGTIWSNETG